ncbi:hypothetical protein LS482_02495 [Sinomicrobium kalidii]|uniref:hypothetical protein n=1 Tax=Sinomicrobium kalidii TaxID=2900738 RepID=UPI001E5DA952|nr:hypothetical protein [Sinomicrobium kalidii]UGU16750.1 hypothetical protein LS482_02495 [Sinomicrobium kalidii]
MPEYITIQEHVERRTYIKGEFHGKFIGYLDPKKSDLIHENFYDLEVISGKIKTIRDENHIRHWETGESEEFQSIETFLTNLPESLPLEVYHKNGSLKTYQINLNEAKLNHFTLSNQVYEHNKIFGDITGDISGYIKHYDVQDKQVEVKDSAAGKVHVSTEKIKTKKQTGKSETRGNYKRWQYYYFDGTTYWGNWIKQHTESTYSLWEVLAILLQGTLLIAFIAPIIIIGWKLIIPIMIIGGIFYLLSTLQTVIVKVFGWLFKFLGIAFLLFLGFGILSLFTNSIQTTKRTNYSDSSEKEVQEIVPSPIIRDSIVSHHRIWEDYNNKEYSGNIEVRVSDFTNAANFRNTISTPLQSVEQYNQIVSQIVEFDNNKLDLLYLMLDSLKVQNNLGEIKFAEVIVSLIQDIPYTLILDNACDAKRYNDNFIENYLQNGGKCEGYIKFGILSPTEFMASLTGDCDTRTLLLFSVLNHYRYDVVMLSSELYKHSVIGINLPYNGTSKIINGKRYVIWETTEKGLPPGVISRKISDMRFWNVSLISNNKI